MYAYLFEGYWRDVGTIQAYWDANMDLLKPEAGLNPEGCGIRTNQAAKALPYDRPPAKVSGSSYAVHSAISPGCIVLGRIENSIISPGVVIEKGAFVKDSIIMHDSIVRQGAGGREVNHRQRGGGRGKCRYRSGRHGQGQHEVSRPYLFRSDRRRQERVHSGGRENRDELHHLPCRQQRRLSLHRPRGR